MTNFTTRIADQTRMIPHSYEETIIEPTRVTPFVRYSEAEKSLMIKGNSTRPDMHEFYYPILRRLKEEQKYSKHLKIHVFFGDINTSTAKVLFDLFKYLRMRSAQGAEVEVTWGAEATNTEMLETGKDYSEIYDLNFKFLVM